MIPLLPLRSSLALQGMTTRPRHRMPESQENAFVPRIVAAIPVLLATDQRFQFGENRLHARIPSRITAIARLSSSL